MTAVSAQLGGGKHGPSPRPTFCVVLVQLVGRLLPVLDALLQWVDEALQERTVGGGKRVRSTMEVSP